MRAWSFFFLSLLFLQNAYSRSHHEPPPAQSKPIPNISEINVIGDINLNLHTGYNKPDVALTGEPSMLDNIQMRVAHGVLFISLKDPSRHCCTSVSANIRTHYLNGLVYHGKGSIRGERLRANLEHVVIDNPGTTLLSGTIKLGYIEVRGGGATQIGGVIAPHLRVKISENSKLKITGQAALRHLSVKDTSWFSLSWLKTTTLIICASENAYVEIAGIVNKLDVELWNSAQFNGRYLRARRAYVKTHDKSVAKMAATEHQHTLAKDASDIRFYNLPEMKTDFMAQDGAVLDMRALNTPFVEEQTPYNIE
jgi:hypothetical protein